MQWRACDLQQEDWRRVAIIFNQVFDDYQYPLFHTEGSLVQTACQMQLDPLLSTVFYSGETPIGLALVARRGYEGWLYSLGIIPSKRKQGMGKALLNYVVDKCKTVGIKRLGLEVLSSNQEAQTLYTNLGFVKKGSLYSYRTQGPLKINHTKEGLPCFTVSLDTLSHLSGAWDEVDLVWSRSWSTLKGREVGTLAYGEKNCLQGYAVFSLGRNLVVYRLAVNPTYRRRGIAQGILISLEKKFQQAEQIIFTNISEHNIDSHTFLRHRGFKVFLKQVLLEQKL